MSRALLPGRVTPSGRFRAQSRPVCLLRARALPARSVGRTGGPALGLPFVCASSVCASDPLRPAACLCPYCAHAPPRLLVVMPLHVNSTLTRILVRVPLSPYNANDTARRLKRIGSTAGRGLAVSQSATTATRKRQAAPRANTPARHRPRTRAELAYANTREFH